MYCTHDDITASIPFRTLAQLSNDDPTAQTPNWTVVDKGVQFATDMVNASLRGRYTLPLEQLDSLVTEWTVAIARHWLYCRRPEGNDLPDAVKQSYKDAVSCLSQVQNGKLDLGNSASLLPQPESGAFAVKAPRRVFSHDRLERY